MRSYRDRSVLLVCLATAAVLTACDGSKRESSSASATPPPAPAVAAATPAVVPPPYGPGLGELMTLQQMRHAKLWWAGGAANWELASYEVDELKEGFDDIVRYHPTHKDAPVPIKDAVPTIMDDPLEKTRQAIAKKDRRLFAAAYDTLTEGCNACHQATNFGFNVVKRPAVNTFSNQSFSPGR